MKGVRTTQKPKQVHSLQRHPEALSAMAVLLLVLVEYPIVTLFPELQDGPWLSPGLHIITVGALVIGAMTIAVLARSSWEAVKVTATGGGTLAILVLIATDPGSHHWLPLLVGPPSWFDPSQCGQYLCAGGLQPMLAAPTAAFAAALTVLLSDLLFHLFHARTLWEARSRKR